MRSLKTNKHGDMLQRLKDSKGQVRRDLVLKLSLCKRESDYIAVEQECAMQKNEIQLKKGWMTDVIMDHKKIPMTIDTKSWRHKFLAKLEWRECEDSYDGYEYYYEEVGPEIVTGSRSKR